MGTDSCYSVELVYQCTAWGPTHAIAELVYQCTAATEAGAAVPLCWVLPVDPPAPKWSAHTLPQMPCTATSRRPREMGGGAGASGVSGVPGPGLIGHGRGLVV